MFLPFVYLSLLTRICFSIHSNIFLFFFYLFIFSPFNLMAGWMILYFSLVPVIFPIAQKPGFQILIFMAGRLSQLEKLGQHIFSPLSFLLIWPCAKLYLKSQSVLWCWLDFTNPFNPYHSSFPFCPPIGFVSDEITTTKY